jgi:hypothetical protein
LLIFVSETFVFLSTYNAKRQRTENVILPVTFREEKWLGVFKNRVLRNIFGFEKEEVTGDGKKLNND